MGSLDVGGRLPSLTLPALASERSINLRGQGRQSTVLVLPHPDCSACRAELEELAERTDELDDWDATPLAVVTEADRELADALPYPVLLDDDGQAHARCGVAEGEAALVVADPWGEIYEVSRSDDDHAFPDGDELVSWVRYLSMRCPECGVPDRPLTGRLEGPVV
ncbi:MAG: redoxin domain-containing protein [Nitriliruptorales bacterium]